MMNNYKKLKLILLAILAFAVLTTACDDQQVLEANKLVDSANKKMNDAKPLVTAAGDRFGKISDDIKDFEASKKAHDGELKELAKSYDQILELYKGATADFTQAAKLSKDETFKSYYEMSAKDVENTAALITQNKLLTQAFADSKTIDEYSKKIDEIKTKNDALKKEGDDISAKLKKLEADVNAKNK